MNRKAILGRAALSFHAIDGVLDMDQILETDPWNQINDFVHNNFVQNILNEFNERVTLNPKHAPTGKRQKGTSYTYFHESSVLSSTLTTDRKSLGRKEAAISMRTTRKNRTSRTNEGKKDEVALANGGSKSGEQKKRISREKDNGKKEETNKPEKEKPKKETGKVRKWAVNLKNEGNGPKKIVTRHSTTVTSTKAENKCSNASRMRKSEQIVTVKSDIKNSTENNSGNPQKKENKKKAVSRKNDGGKKEQSKFADGKEGEEKPRGAAAKNKVERKKPKGETNRDENASKIVVRKNAVVTKRKANEVKVTNASIIRKPAHIASIIKATKSTAMNNSAVSMNMSRTSSKLPIRTSTPKRDNLRISNSSRKEDATVKHNVSTTKKDASVECNVSIKNHCTTETCPTKQLNDNRCISASEESVKCKLEDTRTMKVKKEESLENNETSLVCKLTATLKCNKQNEKMAKTEERKVGKFEKRLLEKQEKRKKRKIQRHERRAERAMEEFGHHVMRIVKEMDYLPESKQIIAGIGFSDESSYSDSDSSWSSCSSCSSCTYCSACN
ncbi:hypothetical protein ANTPLA_LOCUS964 [Anthophora plagiata]